MSALRRERLGAGDGRWGSTPIRMGLWVGSSVTPNRSEEAERWVARRGKQYGGVLGGPLQLAPCPWCGSPL